MVSHVDGEFVVGEEIGADYGLGNISHVEGPLKCKAKMEFNLECESFVNRAAGVIRCKENYDQ